MTYSTIAHATLGGLLAVGMGGCGGDDDPGASDTSTGTMSTTATPTTSASSSMSTETDTSTSAADSTGDSTGTDSTGAPTCEPSPGASISIIFDGAPPGPDGLPPIDALPCEVTVGAGPFALALQCMGEGGPELHMVSFSGDGLVDPAALDGVSAVLDVASNPEDDPFDFFTLTTPEGALLLAFESGSELVSSEAEAAGLGVTQIERDCEFEAVDYGCMSYRRTALEFTLGDDTVELFDGESGMLGDGVAVVLARSQVGESHVDDPCFAIYRYLVVVQ